MLRQQHAAYMTIMVRGLELKSGGTEIDGNVAILTFSAKGELFGEKVDAEGTAELRNYDGIWKLYSIEKIKR